MSPAFVVDLDGTLVRSDVTHEGLLRAFQRRPLGVLRALLALPGGRAAVKARLARLALPAVDSLPYRPEVLAAVERARAEGREVALVSASDTRIVEAVADHLGCFDHRAGSEGTTNLGGQAKARHLVARYGQGNFTYVGDSWRDLPVWASACEAVTVAAGDRLRRAAEQAASRACHIAPPPGAAARLAICLRQLRPQLWLRNAFVFLPVIAAGSIAPADWLRAGIAFAAVCLTAAAIYTVNDLLDLDVDRLHERKRLRPLAHGDLPLAQGALLAVSLGAAAALLSTRVGALPSALAAYAGLALVYMGWLKRVRWLDLLALAALSAMRPLAGVAATGLAAPPALVGAVGCACMAIGGATRLVELAAAAREGPGRLAGRSYRAGDEAAVVAISFAAGGLCAALIAAYAFGAEAAALGLEPGVLIFAAPIVAGWLAHMVMAARRGAMRGDAVTFALGDRVSLACAAGVFTSVAAAAVA